MSTFESTEQLSYDVFVSHASEDKAAVAMPLARRLETLGLRVWIDSLEMTVGGSIPVGIDHGLRRSKLGVVVLSRAFFENPWPRRELDALMALEDSEGRVWLPVWHGVSAEDVVAFSPLLAMKLGVSTQNGLDAVVDAILRAIDASSGAHPLAGPANDGRATRRSASELAAEELATVRRALLQLSTTAELRRQLYVVEEFLERYPKHPEGRELKGHVEKALGFAERPPSAAPPKPRGWPIARGGLAAAILLMAAVLSLWRRQGFVESPKVGVDSSWGSVFPAADSGGAIVPPVPTPEPLPPPTVPRERPVLRPRPVPGPPQPAHAPPQAKAGGAPTGGTGTDVANVRTEGVEFADQAYLRNIVRQIAVRFKPRNPGSLRAEVFFILKRDGTVGEFRFLAKSGVYAFDLEAEAAVESAGSEKAFGPLPESYSNDFLPVIFRFDPSLFR